METVTGPKAAEVKKLEQRVVYHLTITDEPVVEGPVTDVLDLDEHNPVEKKKSRHVVCTYHNGQRIHGKGLGSHPPVVLSARDQDEILWTGEVPFRISFNRIRGAGLLPTPFYRDSWNASEGQDGMFRVASGPLRKIPKGQPQSEYKFTVTRQTTEEGPDDPNSEPLDPHIVVEP